MWQALYTFTLSPNMVIVTIISPIITVLFIHVWWEENSVYQAETLSPDVGFYINIDNIPIYCKMIHLILLLQL